MKQIWFITGISSGLGKALVEHVIQSGDYVIGTFRQATQVADFNQKYEGRAEAVQFDLSDASSASEILSGIADKHGRLDVLVNNAGVGFAGAVEEATQDELRAMFEVNFFGSVALTKAALPIMRAQGAGHVIQISSHAGIKSFPGFGIYNATKYALEGISEALAAEVKPLGIQVGIVEPGPFRTEFAGKGLLEASTILNAYSETAGAFRAKLKSVNGMQEGDPQKAASAIYTWANTPNRGLRLPLGKTALATIESKAKELLGLVEEMKEVGGGVVYGEQD